MPGRRKLFGPHHFHRDPRFSQLEFKPGPGPEGRQPFSAQIRFNVGRPPQLEVGDSQTIALAVNVPLPPFQKLGQYTFTIGIDGTGLRRLPCWVVGQRDTTITAGGPGYTICRHRTETRRAQQNS